MRYTRTTVAIALVEWLPQESMLFDGARATIRLGVELAEDARFIGWDVTRLGRTASGERFASGSVHQKLELIRGDAMLWCERAVFDGGSRALRAGAILDGAPVFGTMLVAEMIPEFQVGSHYHFAKTNGTARGNSANERRAPLAGEDAGGGRQREGEGHVMKIGRRAYAEMFGPTGGDGRP